MGMGVNVSQDAENADTAVDGDIDADGENGAPQISKLELDVDSDEEQKKKKVKEKKRTQSSTSLRAFEEEDNNSGDEGNDKRKKKKTFSLLSLKKQKGDTVKELNGDLDEDEIKGIKSNSIWRRKSKASETDIEEFKSDKKGNESDEETKLPFWKRKGKKKSDETEAENDSNDEEPKEKKTPFWKRKSKHDDELSETKDKNDNEQDISEKEKKVPFWRRKSTTEDKVDELGDSDFDSDKEDNKKKRKKKSNISKSSPSLRLSRFSLKGDADDEDKDDDEEKTKKLPFWKRKKSDEDDFKKEKEKLKKSRSKSVTSLRGSRLSLEDDSKPKKVPFWKRLGKKDDVTDDIEEIVDTETGEDSTSDKKEVKKKSKNKSKLKHSKSMIEDISISRDSVRESDVESIDSEAVEETYLGNRIVSAGSSNGGIDDIKSKALPFWKRAVTNISTITNDEDIEDEDSDSEIKRKKKGKHKNKKSGEKSEKFKKEKGKKKVKRKKKGNNSEQSDEDEENLFQATAPAYIHLAYLNKQKESVVQRHVIKNQELNPFSAEEPDDIMSEVEVLDDIDSDLDELDEYEIPTVPSLHEAAKVVGRSFSSTMNMRELTRSAISVRDAAQSFLSLREAADSPVGFFDTEDTPTKESKKKESFWEKRRRQKNSVTEFIIEESDSGDDKKSKKDKKKKKKDDDKKSKKKSKNDTEDFNDSNVEEAPIPKPRKKSIFKRNVQDKDIDEDKVKKSKKKSKKEDDNLEVTNEQVTNMFNGEQSSDDSKAKNKKRHGADSRLREEADNNSDSEEINETQRNGSPKKKKKTKSVHEADDSVSESEFDDGKPKKAKRKFTFSKKKRESSKIEKVEENQDEDVDDDEEDGGKSKSSKKTKRKSKIKKMKEEEEDDEASTPRDLNTEPISEPDNDLEKEYITQKMLYNVINDGGTNLFVYSSNYLLLLDARTQEQYDSSHIITAIHFSSLQSRDVTDKIKDYAHVIIYDGNGRTFDLTDSDLSQSYDIATDSGNECKILENGYNAFVKKYPYLCTDCNFDTGKVLKRAFPGYPSRILEEVLYTGNGRQSESENVINELLVTHIVNISTEHLDAYPDKVQYLSIPKDGSPKSKLYPEMKRVAQFCSEALENHGCVFIHSHTGENRNAVMCIAVLMHLKRCSLKTAYEHVKKHRSGINVQKNMLRQLSQFEKDLFDKRVTDIHELVSEEIST